jgi:hypothetical protein
MGFREVERTEKKPQISPLCRKTFPEKVRGTAYLSATLRSPRFPVELGGVGMFCAPFGDQELIRMLN